MPNRLFARRFSVTYDANSKLPAENREALDDIADVGLRWSLPGGLQKYTLTIRARSKYDAIARSRGQHGDRLVIHDNWVDWPVADGWIGEIQPDGRHVHYICSSYWWAHARLYETAVNYPTDTLSATIAALITSFVTPVSTSTANITTNSTTLADWGAESGVLNEGEYPQSLIEEMLAISDSSNRQYDYWIQPGPLFYGKPTKPSAYYKVRNVTNPTADWLVTKDMLVPGHQHGGSHIWELATEVTVFYKHITGTHDGGDGKGYLSDSTTDFVAAGVQVGDIVTNLTDERTDSVRGIPNVNKLELSWTEDPRFDDGDAYNVEMQEAQGVTVSTTHSPWKRTIKVNAHRMNKIQATQYGNQLLNIYSQPLHQQPLVIGSPYILKNQGRRPLWRPFIGGGYFRGVDFDLQPNSSATQTAFLATALDYQYRDNTLRVVLSLPDSRLDAVLSDAGVGPGGHTVTTGGRPALATGRGSTWLQL